MLFRLLIFLMALSVAVPAFGQETIHLVADVWCPYNCQEGDERDGYVLDLAREIFNPLGISIEYQVMSWERAKVEVRDGRKTGIIGTARDETPDFIFPEESVGKGGYSFFVRKNDTWQYTGFPSLGGKNIGFPLGYFLDPDMDSFFLLNRGQVSVHFALGPYPSQTNLKKLTGQRIDVVMDDAFVIWYTAKKMGLTDMIAYAGSEKKRSDIYIAFSPESPEAHRYAYIFTQGMRQLRRSGRLAAILAKYGLADWGENIAP